MPKKHQRSDRDEDKDKQTYEITFCICVQVCMCCLLLFLTTTKISREKILHWQPWYWKCFSWQISHPFVSYRLWRVFYSTLLRIEAVQCCSGHLFLHGVQQVQLLPNFQVFVNAARCFSSLREPTQTLKPISPFSVKSTFLCGICRCSTIQASNTMVSLWMNLVKNLNLNVP